MASDLGRHCLPMTFYGFSGKNWFSGKSAGITDRAIYFEDSVRSEALYQTVGCFTNKHNSHFPVTMKRAKVINEHRKKYLVKLTN